MKRKSILALLLMSSVVRANELPAYPFVHVSGTAYLNVVPDQGSVDFELVARDQKVEPAAAVVQHRAQDVRMLTDSLGIAAADIDIDNPRAEWAKDGTAYVVKVQVHINVRDLAKWAALVQPILGMENVDGVMTAFDTSERTRVESDLLVQALADANRKAGVIAGGVGRRLGSVAGVSNSQLKNLTLALGLVPADFRYTHPDNADARQAKSVEQYLSVNALKFQQDVDVLYRMK
jgi:uncharacterized protein YggE